MEQRAEIKIGWATDMMAARYETLYTEFYFNTEPRL